jgi:CRISPR-associated protein Csx3
MAENALHLLHGSPAAAVAFYDPRLGAVVVATHSRELAVGDVIDITLEGYPEQGRSEKAV